MSEHVYVSKEIEVNVEVCVYDVVCGKCGDDMDFTVNTDSDGDIRIKAIANCSCYSNDLDD